MSSRSFTLTDKLLHGCNWACTALSKIDQRWSFILPHDIGLFTVKSWRYFFSTESRECVVWGLPWHCFSMLCFPATLWIEISSRTTLQFFNGVLTFRLRLDLSVAGIGASLCFWSVQWFEKFLFKCFRSTVKNTHRTKISTSGCLAQEVRLNYPQRHHVCGDPLATK